MAVRSTEKKKIAAVLEGRCSRQNICPVKDIMARYGDKWSMYTILLLGRYTTLRFTELRTAITGISQRMLTVTLRLLEEDGMVERRVFSETPPRVEYSLTPLGESLLKQLLHLACWAEQHVEVIKLARKTYLKTTAAHKQKA